MKVLDLVFVHAEDWVALYANGALLHQAHSIDFDIIIKEQFLKTPIVFNSISYKNCYSEYPKYSPEDVGSFPGTIKELEKYKVK